MRMRLFQVRDLVALCFRGPIFVERGNPSAIRMFEDGLRSVESDLGKYPADFELWCLGEYDDSDGKILVALTEFPEVVATGKDFLAAKEAAR